MLRHGICAPDRNGFAEYSPRQANCALQRNFPKANRETRQNGKINAIMRLVNFTKIQFEFAVIDVILTESLR